MCGTGALQTGEPLGPFAPELVSGLHHGQGQQEKQTKQQPVKPKCLRSIPAKAASKLQSSRVPETRQSPRKLRNLHGMSSPMALGRNRMEGAWLLLQVVTASTIFLDNGGWFNPTARIPGGTSSSTQHGAAAWPENPSSSSSSYGNSHTESYEHWAEKAASAFNDIFGSRPSSEARGDAGHRPQPPGPGPGHPQRSGEPLQLAVGKRKRLLGECKRISKTLSAEVLAMERLPPERDKSHGVDLYELFAGAAKAIIFAKDYGLNALEPFDKNEGKDLAAPEAQRLVETALEKFAPLLVLVGFPCTLWSLFNENLNYAHRMEELMALREEQRPMLQWLCKQLKKQAEAGRFFALENSEKSRLWDEECLKELQDLPDAQLVLADGGAFGATDLDGFPIIKTYKFLVNSPVIAHLLHRRLSSQERQVCKPLEGANVTASQVYPDALVRAVLKGLKQEARRLCPSRFETVQVYFAQPVEDHEAWRKLLDEACNTFANSTVKSLVLQPGQEVFKRVQELVPWEVTRVQIASTPMTRRLPVGSVPFTHRGAALLHNDESLTLEAEDLANVTFPKQRFSKVVKAAIFFFGITEDDCPPPSQKSTAEKEIQLPVPGLRTDVTFPNAPKTLPNEVRASVARLHLNTGHANKKELTRLLATHGSINGTTLTAIEHMVCGSCERTKPPSAPRPASIPHFLGQFGERVQMDIVYMRDLTGTNHPVLGMIDLATTFQQAVRLQSRATDHVLDQFRRSWLAPFGYPLVCEVDPDGAFQGSFRSHLEDAGVHLVVIPAEAHWRLGSVERRNAILRSIAERLIDENAVTSGAGLDWILVATVQGLNSTSGTRGRSPYQAVFGRIPRFPGDLMSDDRALAVSDNLMPAEELRSQALRAINEMAASSIIRRALLRKTKPNKEEAKEILPGHLAAYWRWQKKSSGKKRGGYVLGRLLHHDPDNKSAWLQAGHSTVQVTYEQLRPAYGLEAWTPSMTDVRCLKNAEKTLAEGLRQDHRGPGPPQDETLDVDVTLDQEFHEDAAMGLELQPIADVPATSAPSTSRAEVQEALPAPAEEAPNESSHATTPYSSSKTSMSLLTNYTFVVTQVPEEPYLDFERVPESWDGNVKHISPSPPCTAFRVLAAKIEDEEVSSDSSDDEPTPSIP